MSQAAVSKREAEEGMAGTMPNSRALGKRFLAAPPRVPYGNPEQVVSPAKAGVQLLDFTGFRLSPE
jgi:hypothetical protein